MSVLEPTTIKLQCCRTCGIEEKKYDNASSIGSQRDRTVTSVSLMYTESAQTMFLGFRVGGNNRAGS